MAERHFLIKLLLFGILSTAMSQEFPSSICVVWQDSLNCIGNDRTLSETDVRLTYVYSNSNVSRMAVGPVIKKTNGNSRYNLSYDSAVLNDISREANYFFQQLEHGGGDCNCVNIDFNCQENSLSICGGSASLPRQDQLRWRAVNPDSFADSFMYGSTPKESPLQLNCSVSPYIKVSFYLNFNSTGRCIPINGPSEGVEFSLRLTSQLDEWIPITFIYYGSRDSSSIRITESGDNLIIRGFTVEPIDTDRENNIVVSKKVDLQICNINITDQAVQFRWLQTSELDGFTSRQRSVWTLDDLTVTYTSFELGVVTLLNESFDSGILDSNIWPKEHVRNANISSFCYSGYGLLFGENSAGQPEGTIVSRSLLTNFFNIITPTLSSTDFTPFINTNTTEAAITLRKRISILSEEDKSDQDIVLSLDIYVIDEIMQNEELYLIIQEKDPDKSIALLGNVTENEMTNPLVLAYIFNDIIENVTGDELTETLVEQTLNVGGNILQSEFATSIEALVTGVSVLVTYDELLLTYFPDPATFVSPNIILMTEILNITGRSISSQFVAINSSLFQAFKGPAVQLSLPLELLKAFSDSSGLIGIASALYGNVENVLVDDSNQNATLGSAVVASSLLCGQEYCDTREYELMSSRVTIFFEHSDSMKEQITTKNFDVICVFLSLQQENESSSALSIGRWSTEGCTRNASISSSSMTVCECNHLTHFAILLSPKPILLANALALTTIGYIGVTISVVAMILTVIIFIVLTSGLKERPLLTMRNYIHINLCINLSIAQIIFIIGVNKTGPPNGDVPTHCQFIAVLLHYFFLVSFMWMLMEGVILYLALVKVFVTHTKRYIIAFTSISYGFPFFYMALLTLPLGFSLQSGSYYGYDGACFLSPHTGFIWAFIVPVVIIFLANIGFFIMASTISWKQHMKKYDTKKTESVFNWFKSTIPLVVVMGLTWIIGLLVVEVDELAPLAYIFTIMMAFQGVFIFIVLVLLSKAVRRDIKKLLISKMCKKNMPSASCNTGSGRTIPLDQRFGVRNAMNNEKTKTTSLSVSIDWTNPQDSETQQAIDSSAIDSSAIDSSTINSMDVI